MLDVPLFWTMSVAYFFLATALFAYRPSNVVSIISVASAIFVVPPALLYVYHDMQSFYSFRNVADSTNFLERSSLIAEALPIILFMLFSFSLAAWPMMSLFRSKRVTFVATNRRALMITASVLTGLWAIFLLRLLSVSQSGIDTLFIPNVDDDRLPYYEHSIFMSIPLVGIIITLSFRKINRSLLVFFIVMGILTCLTTHQRRELIVLAFTIFGALIFLSDRDWKNILQGKISSVHKWQRKVMFFSLAIGGILVPLAWYARVFSTNLMRGEFVNPFAIRSPIELLMGSPATGFPTFLLIHEYVTYHGAQFGALLLQLLTAAVPRSLFPNKPESIDGTLIEAFSLEEIPSAFWFGELYFNYTYFGIFFACVFGAVLAGSHQALGNGRSVISRGAAILILANFVTFFKNGISIGITRTGITVFILVSAFALAYVVGARKSAENGR